MSISTAFRPTLAAGMLAVLAACTTVPADGGNGGRMVADGQDFSMQSGMSVRLADNSTLRYVRLVNDSRCPPGVQCVWAGDGEIAFEWRAPGADVHAFSLHTTVGDKNAVLGERRLTLLSLERGDAPQAQLQVERNP